MLGESYRVIYVTPEFVSGNNGNGYAVVFCFIYLRYCFFFFLEFLCEIKKKNVVVVAIDEAHCISSWGHDFRYAYSELSILRDFFVGVPLLALTATATRQVQNDIITSLKMKYLQLRFIFKMLSLFLF